MWPSEPTNQRNDEPTKRKHGKSWARSFNVTVNVNDKNKFFFASSYPQGDMDPSLITWSLHCLCRHLSLVLKIFFRKKSRGDEGDGQKSFMPLLSLVRHLLCKEVGLPSACMTFPAARTIMVLSLWTSRKYPSGRWWWWWWWRWWQCSCDLYQFNSVVLCFAKMTDTGC